MTTKTETTNAILIHQNGYDFVAHDLSLSALQASVGGYIEPAFTIPSPIDTRRAEGIALTGYVNEEGLLERLPVAVAVRIAPDYGYAPMAGNMVIVGLDQRDGETIGLTGEELDWIEQRLYLVQAAGKPDAMRVFHALDLAK